MVRYFVVHLLESDRPTTEKSFEIQLLDRQGHALACGYLGADDASLEIEGRVIPAAVIDAARRQLIGQGDYVDENGASVGPL